MAKRVKPKRAYDSSRRKKQAETTQRDILEAAERLFLKQGYAATTMAAIAKEAGTAVKTVYLAFETKSGVLRALWNTLLRGNDGGAPVADQEWFREVLREPDAERQLRLNARNGRIVKQRICGVVEIIHGAAPIDADIAALWDRIKTAFFANQRTIVESVHKKGALRRGLDVDRATDILWTLNHPSLWQLLVSERGWTPDQYEAWLAETSCAQLLAR